MVEEYISIMKNDVWDIVPRPKGKYIVSSRWLYKRNILDFKPFNFKEATDQQVWRDAMVEYTSIKKSDVWDIVPR